MADTASPLTVLIPGTVIFSHIGVDNGVLLDIDGGVFFSLTSTASHLWTQWMQDGSVERSIDSLVDAFAVDRATADKDVRELIDELKAKGLLATAAAD